MMDAVRRILNCIKTIQYLELSWIRVVSEEEKAVHTVYVYSMQEVHGRRMNFNEAFLFSFLRGDFWKLSLLWENMIPPAAWL